MPAALAVSRACRYRCGACRPVAYRRGDDDAVMVRAVARPNLKKLGGLIHRG
jgi:hypothetical protein